MSAAEAICLPLPEAQLAFAQKALGSVAALELQGDIGAGDPVHDLRDPHGCRLKAEPGIPDAALRCPEKAWIARHRPDPRQQPYVDQALCKRVRDGAADAEAPTELSDRDSSHACDPADDLAVSIGVSEG
jgi:hypothetical protein